MFEVGKKYKDTKGKDWLYQGELNLGEKSYYCFAEPRYFADYSWLFDKDTLIGKNQGNAVQIIKPKKRIQGWVNIYQNTIQGGMGRMGYIHSTKEHAYISAEQEPDYFATIYIDVEEGENSK